MSDALLSLLLPMPPSINNYYLNATRKVTTPGAKGYGKTYTARMIGPEGKAYRGYVFAAVRQGHRAAPQLTGRLSVAVLAVPRDLQSFDLDNRWKSLLDALQHAGAILNDAQFDDIRMVRWNPAPPGRVRVRIDKADPREAERFARWIGEPGVPDLLAGA